MRPKWGMDTSTIAATIAVASQTTTGHSNSCIRAKETEREESTAVGQPRPRRGEQDERRRQGARYEQPRSSCLRRGRAGHHTSDVDDDDGQEHRAWVHHYPKAPNWIGHDGIEVLGRDRDNAAKA